MNYSETTHEMRDAEAHFMACKIRYQSAEIRSSVAYTQGASDDEKQGATRERILKERDYKQAKYACKLAGWGWARNAKPYDVTWAWEVVD